MTLIPAALLAAILAGGLATFLPLLAVYAAVVGVAAVSFGSAARAALRRLRGLR